MHFHVGEQVLNSAQLELGHICAAGNYWQSTFTYTKDYMNIHKGQFSYLSHISSQFILVTDHFQHNLLLSPSSDNLKFNVIMGVTYLFLAFLLLVHPQCWREFLGSGWRFLTWANVTIQQFDDEWTRPPDVISYMTLGCPGICCYCRVVIKLSFPLSRLLSSPPPRPHPTHYLPSLYSSAL